MSDLVNNINSIANGPHNPIVGMVTAVITPPAKDLSFEAKPVTNSHATDHETRQGSQKQQASPSAKDAAVDLLA